MEDNRIGRNLEALRVSRGMTQERLAETAGISIASISYWENGWKIPRPASIRKLCRALDCSESDLLGYSDGHYQKSTGIAAIKAMTSHTYAPVAGNVAAGDPREAVELTNEVHWVPPEYLERYPEGFFLRVAGDSMDKVLPDGCYAFIAPSEPQSGDICAVRVNGEDATIKRVKLMDGVVVLEPESSNPEHRRRIIDETDPEAPRFRCLGKVVWVDYEP